MKARRPDGEVLLAELARRRATHTSTEVRAFVLELIGSIEFDMAHGADTATGLEMLEVLANELERLDLTADEWQRVAWRRAMLCQFCAGFGKVSHSQECPACDGTGRREREAVS